MLCSQIEILILLQVPIDRLHGLITNLHNQPNLHNQQTSTTNKPPQPTNLHNQPNSKIIYMTNKQCMYNIWVLVEKKDRREEQGSVLNAKLGKDQKKMDMDMTPNNMT